MGGDGCGYKMGVAEGLELLFFRVVCHGLFLNPVLKLGIAHWILLKWRIMIILMARVGVSSRLLGRYNGRVFSSDEMGWRFIVLRGKGWY